MCKLSCPGPRYIHFWLTTGVGARVVFLKFGGSTEREPLESQNGASAGYSWLNQVLSCCRLSVTYLNLLCGAQL